MGIALEILNLIPGLFRGKNKTNPILSPRQILDGVVRGVGVGGNCSGIPTPQGWCYFNDRYTGKPLVFAGTVGVMPLRTQRQETL